MTTQTAKLNEVSRLAWRRVKKVLRLAKRIFFKETERSSNPYATHVPVLIGLSNLLTFRRIAEFGCGQYSTLTFLNREIFPQLEKLDSFETDPEWLAKMKEKIGGDTRLDLRNVLGKMCETAETIEPDEYDLIFIDDSTCAEERAATIRAVANKRTARTVVVVHDFEAKLYQQASRLFRHRFNCTSLNPNTGILWNDAPVNKKKLKSLNNLIRRRNDLAPDKLDDWENVFKGG